MFQSVVVFFQKYFNDITLFLKHPLIAIKSFWDQRIKLSSPKIKMLLRSMLYLVQPQVFRKLQSICLFYAIFSGCIFQFLFFALFLKNLFLSFFPLTKFDYDKQITQVSVESYISKKELQPSITYFKNMGYRY